MRLPGSAPRLRARVLRVAVADDDRAAVVGDLLRRVAEREHIVVHVARAGRDLLDLNVPPPDLAPAAPLDVVDVAVGGVAVPAAHRVEVAPWSRPSTGPADPLAARLLVLATPLPAEVDPAGLPGAAEELAGWRSRVGTWARSPSAPAPAGAVGDVAAALADGLDGPRALALLRALEADEDLPPGARLEAFLALDRLLGLDLALGLVGG